MKIDVEKLINQISKHPEIYNPDHKDFSNKQVRDNIFDTIISKEINGIKGEILHRKWDQLLNKYASFIRKLSNDDSSETVLERFMKWPWTKHMRIFKPYVRKQFQIPEFESAVQIPEMDPDELPDIPFLMPSPQPTPRPEFLHAISTPIRPVFPHPLSMPRPEFSHRLPRSEFSRPRQEFSHPLSMPRPEFPPSVPMPRPELAHASSRIATRGRIPLGAVNNNYSPPISAPQFAHGMTSAQQRLQMPAFMESIFGSSPTEASRNDSSMFHDIATMLGLDQPSDEDSDAESMDTDRETETDEEEAAAEGRPAAKKSRLTENPDNVSEELHKDDDNDNTVIADSNNVANDDDQTKHGNGKEVLPDLPQPKPLAERRLSDFTAQEHIFLAWAKTMSTFTAKRQAKIKMQINKIMSEAEFEDLDDEFFAANSPPRRQIYTSRK